MTERKFRNYIYPETDFEVVTELLTGFGFNLYRDDGELLWFTKEDPSNITDYYSLVMVPKEPRIFGVTISGIVKQSGISERKFRSVLDFLNHKKTLAQKELL